MQRGGTFWLRGPIESFYPGKLESRVQVPSPEKGVGLTVRSRMDCLPWSGHEEFRQTIRGRVGIKRCHRIGQAVSKALTHHQ